jgi:hypothetical protein
MALSIKRSNEELSIEKGKKQLSEKKLRANRDSAKKSTGPKNTSLTKYNATKHALAAAGVSRLDYAAGYNKILGDLIEEKQPLGVIELCLVESIALDVIRIRRARQMEADYIDEWCYEPEAPLLYDGIMRPRLRTQTDVAERLVGTYQRYEQMFTTRLSKHLHELERLQRMRGGEVVAAPTAVDVNVHIGATKKKEDAAPPTLEQKFSKEADDSVQ